jgi:hypothetical protein
MRPNAEFIVFAKGPAARFQFGYPGPEIVGREFDAETALVTSPLKAIFPFIERHSTSPLLVQIGVGLAQRLPQHLAILRANTIP